MIEPAARIASEQRVVDQVCKRWSCASIRMPDRYLMSYALLHGREAIAWMDIGIFEESLAEIGRAGGFPFPVPKWNAAQILTTFTGRPFYLAAMTSDGGWVAPFRDFESCGIRIERDAEDHHTVMVPVNRFLNFRDNFERIKP